MLHLPKTPSLAPLPALLLALALAACGDTADTTAATASAAGAPTPTRVAGEQPDPLAALRQATARFHSTTQAAAAGYLATDQCVPGMGFHWVNPSLVDAVYDPRQPEVMLYATAPDGRLELVAVEYIVVDAGQARPAFAGHAFDVGGTPVPVPHWSQHVWLYEPNPDGVFSAYSPAVACR